MADSIVLPPLKVTVIIDTVGIFSDVSIFILIFFNRAVLDHNAQQNAIISFLKACPDKEFDESPNLKNPGAPSTA